MSLLDEVLKESHQPHEGGVVGALKKWGDHQPTINGGVSLPDMSKWFDRFMQPSALDRAVKEIPVEDMGIYKYAAVDENGVPVAFYGEQFRETCLKLAEERA